MIVIPCIGRGWVCDTMYMESGYDCFIPCLWMVGFASPCIGSGWICYTDHSMVVLVLVVFQR